MRTIFVALLALLLNALTITDLGKLGLPQNLLEQAGPYLDIYKTWSVEIFTAFVAYFALEALVSLGKARRLDEKNQRLTRQVADENRENLARSQKLEEEVHQFRQKLINGEEKYANAVKAREKAESELPEIRKALGEAQARNEALSKNNSEKQSSSEADVINFLKLLQSKGRFLDFIMDDITPFSDEQIGRAARFVHEGCRSLIRDYFDLKPIASVQEGSSLQLGASYNASEYRLVGKVGNEPPYRGKLVHPGWKTTKVDLPRVFKVAEGSDGSKIITAAEVEL